MTIRPIRFILFCLSLIFIVSSCKRINEATDLGDDVIPEGVDTFDTTLTSLQTFNHIFDPLKDSVKVGFDNAQILGNISGDPLFGKTNARMFLQLKPETYPWSFSGIYKKDSLYIDSVVLVLGYNASYGDTVASQKVTVKEINPLSDFRVDSFYTIYDPGPPTIPTPLGPTKTFSPQNLKDSVKVYQDTTAGQLRIRLDNSFGRRLLDYDTTGAYKSDSLFSTYFKGFAIEPDQSSGNALMAFGIYNNPNTKLAIYYRYTKGGQDDTTVNYFVFKPGFSANHNYVKRDFSTQVLSTSNDNVEDNPAYIINTPGSYVTVKIPALKDLSNRIINRAELIVEQVYDASNEKFPYPYSLMLDVYDSTLDDYKCVPFDFVPNIQAGAGFYPTAIPNPSFGLYGKNTVDGAGNPVRVWKFNLTRYVQNILTKQEPLHDLRLYITNNSIERIKQGPASNTGGYEFVNIVLNPYVAFGRVMVGGGKHPTQTMRLRIVHTKI